jgi:GntR family transcriptional regulator / MocR family aminotransferase
MVKTARGPLIAIEREAQLAGLPRRLWVYRSVLAAIRRGALAPGERLPSSRQLASEWRVARGAVDEAYEQLSAEGLLERRVGDGTYVSARLPDGVRMGAQAAVRAPSATTQAVLERLRPLLVPVLRNDLRPLALRPSIPDVAHFPLAAWKRCSARALEQDGERSRLWFGAPAGLDELRALTAQHLALTGAAQCRAEQVIIVNSQAQALELIARVLLSPGDAVAVEDPGHASVARLLSMHHLQVQGVPLDDDGLSVAALQERAGHAAAVFLTGFNQYPLGIVTQPSRAAELMRWADQSGAWIVETQFMRELAHDAPPPPPLTLLDAAERVLLVGSFSAMTFPSLRLAYLVVPERLVDVFTMVRGMLGDHSAVASQAALAAFLRGGHASAHLRSLARLYRERRDVLCAAAARQWPRWARLGPMGGAFNAALHLPPEVNDVTLMHALAARGVACGALSQHAWQVEGCNGLVLGYGAYDAPAIEWAAGVIGECLGAYQPAGENR